MQQHYCADSAMGCTSGPCLEDLTITVEKTTKRPSERSSSAATVATPKTLWKAATTTAEEERGSPEEAVGGE